MLKIQKKRDYYFLISCYHSLSNAIKDKSDIEIRLKDEKKYIIELDDKNRLIKCIEEKDIASIEIKNKDNLQKAIYFLNLDLNNINSNSFDIYNNKEIIILEYYKGKIYYKKGSIIDVNGSNFEFKHNLAAEEESDGSPIILSENSSVIGMQKRTSFGTFISELLKELI